MSQIFLSYSSNDRERVIPLVHALQEDGYTVWWDREIRPGPSFDREIEREISEAGCIVVVWSANSVESEWVRAEVEEGARRGLLVPVLIDEVLPPLAHRRRQAANLTGWDGERDGEYAKLVSGIEATLGGEQPQPEVNDTRPSHVAAPPRRRRRRANWIELAGTALASLVVGAGLAYVFLQQMRETQPSPAEVKFDVQLPQGFGVTSSVGYPVTITPDGQTIVYNATDVTGKEGIRYFARPLGSRTSRPIEGVESHQVTGLGSLWSGPKGEWFIYNDPIARAYKKERISGGTPIPIASTNLSQGGILGLDWGKNGDIVFANSGNPAIMLLKGGAGEATPLTHPPDGMVDGNPRFTPDGRAVVYVQSKQGPSNGEDASKVMVLDLASGKASTLLDGDAPRVTKGGHLLFERKNILWATAFDEKHLAVYGKQVPVLEGLMPGMNAWDIAENGTLIYVPNDAGAEADTHLMWLSADGRTEAVPSFQHTIGTPILSPNNALLAVTSLDNVSNGQSSIWIYAFDKQIASRLTFNQGFSALPQWSPDGKWIVYSAGIGVRNFQITVRAADGTGEARQLTEAAREMDPSFTPDGKSIVFVTCEKQCDIARTGVKGKGPFDVVLKTKFDERAPSVSPNGRWLVYSSNASGQTEIFVRPWPNVQDGRWQISNNGGEVPIWSHDGSTIYYVQPGSNELMAVAVGAGKEFSADRPKSVADFSGYDWQGPANSANFSISNDGKRFLVIKSKPNNKIVVVLNWLNEVKRLVPTER